jgi:hypothetical protein
MRLSRHGHAVVCRRSRCVTPIMTRRSFGVTSIYRPAPWIARAYHEAGMADTSGLFAG